MLLRQLTIAASGWVVILPVLISHLHSNKTDPEARVNERTTKGSTQRKQTAHYRTMVLSTISGLGTFS